MIQKIRIALIYKKTYNFFQEDHFDKTTYDFFLKALQRNTRLEISCFPCDDVFETSQLKGKFDVILLPETISSAAPKKLIGINELNIPVIARTGDPHSATKYDLVTIHDELKINHYFGVVPKSYFYKFLPKKCKYKTIIFGLESSLYETVKPFKDRIKDRILVSGAMGQTDLKSKFIDKFLLPRRTGLYFYKLRTMCKKLPYVDYSGMKGKQYTHKDYPSYLASYRAAISATTYYPSQKYWEISAAGCLTFMEITKTNDGYYLGYEDGKSAIFINEKNYKKKFEEYLNDPDNPKWEEIAFNGRKHTLENLNNDKAVESLVDLIDSLIH